MLRIKRHVNTFFNSVSYVIFNDEQQACWIVDVGDCEAIYKMIEGYDLKGIFLTHIHYDHIYGLNDLQKIYTQVHIYTNEFGLKSLVTPTDNLSVYHDDHFVLRDISKVITLKEGDKINIGCSKVIVLETPGHDYSCLSYLVDNMCFTGDSYIPGVNVFTKLQNGNNEVAKRSKERLALLSEIVIYPGHLINSNR